MSADKNRDQAHDAQENTSPSHPRTETEKANSQKMSRFQAFMHKHFPEAKAHDRWTLVFTSVIAVSTFIYMIAAVWTLVEMSRSTTAAKSAAETARDTFRLTYRPRLKILGITQNQEMINGKLHTNLDKGRLTVRIDVPNTGPFPARNVRFFRYDNVSKRDQVAQRPYEELKGEP